MNASGQVTSGHWAALLVGVVLLLFFVAPAAATIMRMYRARRDEGARESTDGIADLLRSAAGPSLWRCQALIAEAIVVRQRLSGEIDAETYQIRMNDLARQATSEHHAQPNAQ